MKGQYLRLSCRVSKLVLFFSFISIPLFSQIQVIVLDEVDNSPLDLVEVFSDSFDRKYETNIKGEISLDTFGVSSFHFNKQGYSSVEIPLSKLKDKHVVLLSPISQILEEVILIGQTTLREEDQHHQIEQITSQQIAFTNPQTSADALADHGGIFIQKSQMGGGSPIVRGFEANRVLLVVDGVRMNNAIYRNGHLQNAITIDASVIDNVNILYGPNSLAFGSDAIGGVVSFKTMNPSFSDDEYLKSNVNAFIRHSSANNEKTIHTHFSLGKRNLSSLTSLTFSDFGDLNTGTHRDDRFPEFGTRPFYVTTTANGEDQITVNQDSNKQVGTRYYQYDFLQKFIFRLKSHTFLTANIQYSNTGNIPRYDNLQEVRDDLPRFAEWYYGPQTRMLTSLQYKNYNPKALYDQYIWTAAYQYIEEDRISRGFNTSLRSIQNEDVHVRSMTLELKKDLNLGLADISLLYGLDIQDNDVVSKAFRENIITLNRNQDELSRYADGENDFLTYGAFMEAEWSKKDSPLEIKAGLRFSGTHYSISYLDGGIVQWPEEFIKGVSSSNEALTWSISALYHSPNNWYLRGLTSTAFRAPNIDDLSKIRVNADEITFPNLNLNPEKSISSEIGTGLSKDRWRIDGTIFYTRLSDAIVRRPFATPDGSPTYQTFGESLNVVANQNAQEAYVYGVSLSGRIDLSEAWSIESSYNYTKGREIVDNGVNLPFAHIPPIYGFLLLDYHVKERWKARFSVRYNGSKNIEDFGGSEDNPDLATPIGSLGWTAYNFYSEYALNPQLSISVAIENILDKHYRPFASGVSAPGRNFIFTLRTNFSS